MALSRNQVYFSVLNLRFIFARLSASIGSIENFFFLLVFYIFNDGVRVSRKNIMKAKPEKNIFLLQLSIFARPCFTLRIEPCFFLTRLWWKRKGFLQFIKWYWVFLGIVALWDIRISGIIKLLVNSKHIGILINANSQYPNSYNFIVLQSSNTVVNNKK